MIGKIVLVNTYLRNFAVYVRVVVDVLYVKGSP